MKAPNRQPQLSLLVLPSYARDNPVAASVALHIGYGFRVSWLRVDPVSMPLVLDSDDANYADPIWARAATGYTADVAGILANMGRPSGIVVANSSAEPYASGRWIGGIGEATLRVVEAYSATKPIGLLSAPRLESESGDPFPTPIDDRVRRVERLGLTVLRELKEAPGLAVADMVQI